MIPCDLLTTKGKDVLLRVTARPNARESRLALEEGRLLAFMGAAPRDGQANRELLALLAGALGVPRAALSVCAGGAGREKVVRVANASAAAIAGALAAFRFN